MNKHIFLMGMAAAMFMTSCTNEDDLAGGSNNQRLNSDVPIVLSAGQQANKTRAALGNVVDGKYDGTFDTPADKTSASSVLLLAGLQLSRKLLGRTAMTTLTSFG